MLFKSLILLFVFLVFSCSPDLPSFQSESDFLHNSETAQFKILSYNIWALPVPFGHEIEKRIKKLSKHLNDFDIILLQEAFHSESHSLEKQANFNYSFFHNNSSLFKLNSGLGILSRYPIVNVQFMPFSACEGLECFANKGVLFVRLKHPELGYLDIFNTHFHSSGGSEDTQTTDKIREDNNSRTLMKFMAQQDKGYPTIIGGDFNLKDSSSTYKNLLKTVPLIDTFLWNSLQDIGKRYTQPYLTSQDIKGFTYDSKNNRFAKGSPKRIDYIFILDQPFFQFEILNSDLAFNKPIDNLLLSDHFAVTTEIKITPLVQE